MGKSRQNSTTTVDREKDEIQKAMGHEKAEFEALEVARHGGREIDELIDDMERQLDEAGGLNKGFFQVQFANPKHFTWLLVAFASMGGLLSGLDQSLISGANLFLPDDLGLTDHENSLVNSGMPLGAVGGALLLSPANEYFGRKGAIIISIILYTIGAALEAGSINFGMIVSSRVILGLGVGLEGGTVPVYVAETVERRIRGNLVSLYQFNIALGEVLGYAIGALFLNVPGNWRYILGSSLLFSTIMFFGMLFLPESPRFLIHQKRHLDAYKVWKRIRGIEDRESREEFYVMSASVISEENAVAEGAKNHRFPWMDFFTEPRARRALVYANIMILLGQLTGVNAIMYYMSVLMNQIGFDKKESNYMSLVGGGSLLLGTIPAIFLMERFGRRFWAITMLPGFFIGLVLIGVSYQFDVTTQLQTVEGLYLSGLIIYMGFFGSYACLTWVVPSEVYPTYLRSYGMTTSDALLFLASFVVTYNFTAMQNAMGRTGLALGFYGGIAFVGEIYQIFFMPETKNKTLEEIDEVFSRPTMDIVRENWAGVKETTRLLLTGHWHKVFVEQAMTDPKDQVEVSHA
ncbi:major facilitator superfamily transporter SP family major inositol transporter [Fusarium subglutinans]|uniref:Major facilitator superfamily transporter SP family major inositol transporter n=1 Tax=Gibberella subglutinans TaxID=42677 RepID=A0A8H5UZ14_GIBSU|nr:major facilitator superfamily transporter SP family major inositol transporter [Fusarium subglutinans]KAF5602419.1 major facilitator superfamily transporter SP family major inositol transporter [Fusarium subglutinans]